MAPTAPRDTLEYRTALELELWKEEQEDLFDDQVHRTGSYCKKSNELKKPNFVFFKYKHSAAWSMKFLFFIFCFFYKKHKLCVVFMLFTAVVCPIPLTCLFFCWIKHKHKQTLKLFVSVAEEGAEPHAGSGRGVEKERPRERSSGQEEGGAFTAYTNTHNGHTFHSVLRDLLSIQTHGPLKPESNECKLFYSLSGCLCFLSAYSQISVCSQEVEYNVLEEQLQKTLSDLEKREKQLTEAELEVRLASPSTHRFFSLASCSTVEISAIFLLSRHSEIYLLINPCNT